MGASATESRGRTAIAAAVVGNALEWYDFTVYSLFSVTIAKNFFPSGSEVGSLLLTFATFGVGFVLRPLGAILLGQYADRAGRRAALSLIILLMTLGTGMIALAPTYARIGVVAPLLIVVARLIQGFSVGGEMGGATAFLIESAPPNRRGFYASWQFAGQAAAALFGTLVGTLVTRVLSPGELDSWGWRAPFLVGLLIAPVGLYLRARMIDPPEFLAARPAADLPIAALWRGHRRAVLVSFGVTILGTACTYLVLFYMPTYATKQLGIALGDSFIAGTITSFLYLALTPVTGGLSDRFGARNMMLGAALALAVLVYPLFRLLLADPTLLVLVAVQSVLAVLLASFTGPSAALIGGLFPARLRSTGLSLGYSIAVMIFGGFAPFFVTWLDTGDHLAPAYYMMVCAIPTLAALIALRPAPAGREHG